ncbi:MAG: class I SAM-dependent methyltransferase [Acidimicrobiales bacterium]
MSGVDDRQGRPGHEWREVNRAWWEERAPIHEASQFYRDGLGGLRDFEWEDLGSVDGLRVIHPQCHIGTDTLSLARAGAEVVGLDFSAGATAAAGRLAEAAGLADRAEWITSDVHDAPESVGGRTFDLVYTGQGALCWLPDMDRWADVMWRLCRPGGRLYVSEFHPVQDILEVETTRFERSYFGDGTGDRFDDEIGSYADPDAVTTNNSIIDFVHGLAEVVQALLTVGFVLERFREFPFCVYPRWDFLEEREERMWFMPANRPQIPMMYSLRLRRPE